MAPACFSLWPLRLFAFLLIPFACWQPWLFPGIPNYYAQHFLLYPCLIFMLWAWRRGLWSMAEAWAVLRPFLPWLLLLFAMQAAAGWHSAQLFLPQNASRLRAVLVGLLKLAAQMPFVLFFAVLCRVLMRDAEARRQLVRGACWAFAALALWCAVQAIYVYGVATPDYGAEESRGLLRDLAHAALSALSPWLEARWPDATYDFYSRGAYALTLTRFNGFFEEASALATMVGVFFVPLAFGLLAMADRKRGFLFAGFGILVCSLAIMIFCRSGTGQILAAVTLGLTLLFCLRGRGKALKTLVALALAAVCVYAAIKTPHVPSYLLKRTTWQNVGTLPRVTVTLDTLEMIAEHPVLGVGRNWYFAHLHNGRHYMQNLADDELRDWKEKGSGGDLSALPTLAAQYGLPLVMAAMLFVFTVWLRLQKLHLARPADSALHFAAAACTAWLILGFVASLALLDIRNPLFSLPFFCFYALSQQVGPKETGGSAGA